MYLSILRPPFHVSEVSIPPEDEKGKRKILQMSQLTVHTFVSFAGLRPLAFWEGACYHLIYSVNYYRWELPPETREGAAMEERTELREELLRDLEALYQLPAFSDLAALLQGEARVLQYLALRRGEDVYPSELAEALRLSRPRITAALSSLRRKGFLTLTPSQEDRRKVFVRVTEAGMAQIGGQYTTVRGYFDRLLAGLGPEDSRELSRLVGRCAQVMKEEKA